MGLLLILFGVYNTTKDLELIHEVDNLYRFAKSNIDKYHRADELVQTLTSPTSSDYQIVIVDHSGAIHHPHKNVNNRFPLNLNKLEPLGISTPGGYVDVKNHTYTWVKLPISDTGKQLVLMHKFEGNQSGNQLHIYLKRLLIPVIFYIWLMVWVGLILRYLTGKLQSQNEELKQMALHDSLTGLPNRLLLDDRLNTLIQKCHSNQCTFALAVIDLNKFKAVNDSLGHDQGDELLCQVAARIGTILKTDTFARIGGDEFVLLLNGVNEASSIGKCEEIKEAILKPYILREGEVNIGLSIGIALFPEHGVESNTLMRHADLAMYSIKSREGGIHVYTEPQQSQYQPDAVSV